MPEVSRHRVGPLVPYTHPVFLQIAHVGIALQEPKEFIDDALEVDFLGGQKGKTLREVETHLMAENTDDARAGAVVLLHTLVEDALQEVKILFHGVGCN